MKVFSFEGLHVGSDRLHKVIDDEFVARRISSFIISRILGMKYAIN